MFVNKYRRKSYDPAMFLTGKEVLATPLSGLVNCLSAPQSAISAAVSLLCSDGVRQRCPPISGCALASTEPPLRPDAILHALCTPTLLCTVARSSATQHYQLEMYNLSTAAVAVVPPLLHFQPRALSGCTADDGTLWVVVGGYDGAYVSKDGNALHVLPGCRGFAVCVVKARQHGIAVALVDGRVAVWNCADSSPQTLIQMPASACSGPGDRVTDVTFSRERLVVAYWSGLVAVYDRSNTTESAQSDEALGWKHSEICSVWTTRGQAIGESTFFKRGPTVIVEGAEGDSEIGVVDGSGCVVFLELSDGASVRREIVRTSATAAAVKVKGACAVGVGDRDGQDGARRVLAWVTGTNNLVSVDWPSSKEMSMARRVAAVVEGRLKKCVGGT